MTIIVRSWREIQALLIAFVYLWVPPRGEGDTAIQADGYEWLHALMPHRIINGVSDFEVLVARDQKQADDFQPWLQTHNALFRLNQDLCLIKDFRPGVPYFDYVRRNPRAMTLIKERVGRGASFRPYEWDHSMSRDAESFGFPPSQWYNFVPYNERLEREISPDAAIQECGFPLKMCATRESVRADDVCEAIAHWRVTNRYQGVILLELEARAGGAFSVRVEKGQETNPNVDQFLADHSEANILVRPLFEGEVQWSVQYESGEGGFVRRDGVNEKRYAPGPKGKLIKAGSRMGFDALPSIPLEHVKQGIFWGDQLAAEIYRQKTGPCSLSIIYIYLPGVEHPLLLRVNDRDDSEVVLRKLLERIDELTGVLLYGQHTRLYFFKHSWTDLAQMLENELYELGKSEGCILHVPYMDVARTQECGREVRTVLLMQVAEDPTTFDLALNRIKARIKAWGPGE